LSPSEGEEAIRQLAALWAYLDEKYPGIAVQARIALGFDA
jgi:hypothetical protein